MRWQLTLTRQLLLFQLGIVLLVVTAVAAVSLAGSDAAFRRDQGARLRSVAANLAANDTVRQGVAGLPPAVSVGPGSAAVPPVADPPSAL